jgi:hypothetical protein
MEGSGLTGCRMVSTVWEMDSPLRGKRTRKANGSHEQTKQKHRERTRAQFTTQQEDF